MEVKMEESNEAAGAEANPTPHKVELQPIEDFMKEEDAKDASKVPDSWEQPPAKKQKKGVDVEALAAEEQATKDMGDMNWIGKLNEYRSVHPPASGLTYIETAVPGNPPRFTCAVELRETPIRFNNSASVTFSNKKAAKHYASKRAIDWLVGNGFMPKDGSVKFSKHPPQLTKRAKIPPPPPKAKTPTDLAGNASTPVKPSEPKTKFVGQVPELCKRLGFEIPRYELTKNTDNAALWSGYAHFGGDPRIDGPVGEVKNIYGQKSAKELIAEELVSFLKSIEKHRLEQQEVDEKKRKRESEEPVHEDLAEQAVKSMKTEQHDKPQAADFFQ
ncbi:hypothetical protein BJ875DRAFT_461944 [Amylocarpus encephaloides]|uniref:DRBM domain-containing protein n=1 Tax=Amylocarpus encephaloides TaxID=45428 RepID=A0A9P7YIR4_9HELO|nr:hypothetical protein BJ875DRAFT_461944 [Amylocarpus encephaloides]